MLTNTVLKDITDYLKIIFPAIIISWVITNFFIANTVVPTGSMESTIMTGSRLIGNRLAYQFDSDPERGDIIIFKYPDDESIYYVKRIIGLPGDTIEIIPTKDIISLDVPIGQVYVNGFPINEDYINEPMEVSEYMKFEVPKDSYFCMGDNRNNSYDSRYWKNHFVKRNKIVAKAIFQYWKGFKVF